MLHVRGVDDGEPAGREAACQLAMECRKRGPRGALVRLVTGDDRAVRVGAQDLVRREVARRERRLATSGRPDEDDESRDGDDDARDGRARDVGQLAIRRAS